MAWYIVKDGVIINHIVYDPNSGWIPPEGEVMEFDPSTGVDIGWKYLNGVLAPGEWTIENGVLVPPPVPEEIVTDEQPQEPPEIVAD